jgi:acyl-homoserine lactone acylase PvdQ
MRIRQLFENTEAAGELLSVDDMAAMQIDRLSLPAQEDLPLLASLLSQPRDTEHAEAARQALLSWDAQSTADSIGTTVYRHFMTEWCALVSAARFSPSTAPLLAGGLEPQARRLLSADPHFWFPSDGARLAAISEAFGTTVERIIDALGPDPAGCVRVIISHVAILKQSVLSLPSLGTASVSGLTVTDCTQVGVG